jgi:type II secretory pathway pseudopilin PulG
MLTRAWRELRSQPTDAGISLTELVVAMALTTIVGAMTLSFFLSSGRAANRTTDASLTTAQARLALTSVSTLLRLADTPTVQAGYSTARFEQITSSQVTFYSNDNANRSGTGSRTAPDKIVLTAMVSATTHKTQLVEQLFRPISPTIPADYTQNYNSTPTGTRVLVDSLSSTAVFSYCSATIDAGTGLCVPATTTTSVASVTVSLTLVGIPGENPQTLTSTIAITGALS